MARNYNQDYFKVAGTHIDDRDQTRQSRAKLAHQTSMLRYAREQEQFPTKKVGPQAKKQAATATKAVSKEPRTSERSKPKVRRAEAGQPVAQVHAIRPEKPKHGKKRRSVKKRHEVDVIQELRANPNLTPHSAGKFVRGDERAASAGAAVPSEALPNAAPTKELGGIFGMVRSGYRTGRQVLVYAKDLVTAPITLARVIRGLRERNAHR